MLILAFSRFEVCFSNIRMNLLENIKKGVVFADTISQSPSLNVNRLPVYKTMTGGILSIVIHITTLLGLGYFGKEILYKNEPVSIDSSKEFSSLEFNVKKNDYYFFIGIENKAREYFSDSTVFEMSAKKSGYVYEGTVMKFWNEPVKVGLCREFFESSDELANDQVKVDLDTFYCLQQDVSKIEGFWGADQFSCINIYLSKCVNTTENNNHCKSPDEIDFAVEGGIFDIFSLNHILQLGNYEVPVQKYYDDIIYPLNKELSFLVFINLRTLEFFTDSGLILQDEQSSQYPYSNDPIIFYYENRETVMAEVQIQGKSLGRKINRSYLKLQSLLTQIGGFIKAISIIAQMIIGYISRMSIYTDIKHNIDVRKQIICNPLTILCNEISGNFIKNNFVNEGDINSKSSPKQYTTSSLPGTSVYLTSKNYPIKQNINDFIKYSCSLLSRKKQATPIIKSIEHKLNSALSVDYILENSFIVEYLAQRVLTEEQLPYLETKYIEVMSQSHDKNKKSVFL